jgi:hypothetical protein
MTGDGKLNATNPEDGSAAAEPAVVVEEEVVQSKKDKRAEEDTVRHTLTEAASKVDIDVAEAAKRLQETAERSEKEARSLLLESRRTRMASRPGMKRPFIK